MEGKGKGMNGTVVIMEYCGLLADDVDLTCGLEYWKPVAVFPKADRVGQSSVDFLRMGTIYEESTFLRVEFE